MKKSLLAQAIQAVKANPPHMTSTTPEPKHSVYYNDTERNHPLRRATDKIEHEQACNLRWPATIGTKDDYCDCAEIRAFAAKRAAQPEMNPYAKMLTELLERKPILTRMEFEPLEAWAFRVITELAAPVPAAPADNGELPRCAAYGIKSESGFNPEDGHKGLLGVSLQPFGTAFQQVRLFSEDQVRACILADRARSYTAWAEYLREGETPLERLQREIKDSDSLATLLASARQAAIAQPSGDAPDEEQGWAYGRAKASKPIPKWAEVQRCAEEFGGRVVGNKLSFPTGEGKALFDIWYAENAPASLRVRSIFKPFAAAPQPPSTGIGHWNDGSPPVDWTPEAVTELHAVLSEYTPEPRVDAEDAARKQFEALASDSYGFKRSRKGNYVNATVARDWKWFRLGINTRTAALIDAARKERASE